MDKLDKLGFKALENVEMTEEQREKFMDGLSCLASICVEELKLRHAQNCIIMGFVNDSGEKFELVFQKIQDKSPQTIASEFRKELIELANDIEASDVLDDDVLVRINAKVYNNLQEKYHGAE